MPGVLACLSPPPRQPERATRPSPALTAQSTLRPGVDPSGARSDRAGSLRHLQAGHSRKAREIGPVVVIIVLALAGWLFLALPVRRRQRAHGAMQDSVVVGDEIITAGGMHAVVKETNENELRVEIAPQVVVTVERRAVAAGGPDPPTSDDDQTAR